MLPVCSVKSYCVTLLPAIFFSPSLENTFVDSPTFPFNNVFSPRFTFEYIIETTYSSFPLGTLYRVDSELFATDILTLFSACTYSQFSSVNITSLPFKPFVSEVFKADVPIPTTVAPSICGTSNEIVESLIGKELVPSTNCVSTLS